MENGSVEIVSLPMKHGGPSSSLFKRLPEGTVIITHRLLIHNVFTKGPKDPREMTDVFLSSVFFDGD